MAGLCCLIQVTTKVMKPVSAAFTRMGHAKKRALPGPRGGKEGWQAYRLTRSAIFMPLIHRATFRRLKSMREQPLGATSKSNWCKKRRCCLGSVSRIVFHSKGTNSRLAFGGEENQTSRSFTAKDFKSISG